MAADAQTVRRWFGALVLAAALGMLIAGETVLKGRLQNLGFLLYWLACFCLTGLAFLAALLDARALRQRARRQRRDLLETALKDIQSEARSRMRGQGGQRPGRR